MTFGLADNIVDRSSYERTVAHLRQRNVRLPKFAELADPRTIEPTVTSTLPDISPDDAHALNLFRVHWYNNESGSGLQETPHHLVLPQALTGVEAPIVVLLADRFPLVQAHKVLAAYGCLVTRIVTGEFDPTRHRAVWPSTGNYCRGGVAISRILGCRGVAVLPAGMSRERFKWLEQWVSHPDDIVQTVGTESNVKEIYDKCKELGGDSTNVVLNQFSEFGNYMAHYACTGPAVERAFQALRVEQKSAKLAAFVAGTGSSGTLAAGDFLKRRHQSRIVAVEPRECPTLLYNGYGDHNIQGIGDKHVPLIHNVMNTDLVAAVSDRATNALNVLFNTEAGQGFLEGRRRIDRTRVDGLPSIGLSGIANILACIKTVKYFQLAHDDVVVTVATDAASMYGSELHRELGATYPHGFDQVEAAETYGRYILGCTCDDVRELTYPEKNRIFNLGYYTWVEQQGIGIEDFDSRRHQSFWDSVRDKIGRYDTLIEEFNRRSAGTVG